MDAGQRTSHSPRLFDRQNLKRTFDNRSRSDEAPAQSTNEHYMNIGSPSQRRRLSPSLPPIALPTRSVGDGMDYRYPVSSSSSSQPSRGIPIVDLTNQDESPIPAIAGSRSSTPRIALPIHNSRLPRYARDIINIESDEEDADDAGDEDYEEADEYLQEGSAVENAQDAFTDWDGRQPLIPSRPGSRSFPQPEVINLVHLDSLSSTGTDDVQFVAENIRADRQNSRPRAPAPSAIDLTADNDDDLMVVGESTRENAAPIENRQQQYSRLNPFAYSFGAASDLVQNHTPARLLERIFNNPAYAPNRRSTMGTDPALYSASVHQQRNALLREARLNEHAEHAHRLAHTVHHNLHHNAHAHAHRLGHPAPSHHHHHRVHQPNQRAHGPMPPSNIRFEEYTGINLNYSDAGFDIRRDFHRRRASPDPPEPQYAPPPAPAEGFTRNPTEDEIVVCPNCGRELGMGKDEIAQQVWVVKNCGHAYCGECAASRLRRNKRSTRKGKGRAMDVEIVSDITPLKKCVVHDCGKVITEKSMVHVYMSS